MPTIQEQFEYKRIPQYFEQDTHTEIQDLEIDSIRILYGESSKQDIIVISYKDSPNLSFYSSTGQLIDVDHYLPSNYREEDLKSSQEILKTVKNLDPKADQLGRFKDLLSDLVKDDGALHHQLNKKHGLAANMNTDQQFYESISHDPQDNDFSSRIRTTFRSYSAFLEAYIVVMQKETSGYVHFTPNDNIIISSLNKSSGLSVIIETQDVQGKLLPPNKWIITRTINKENLDQALVFRTEDVKHFFKSDGKTFTFDTERYKLYHEYGELSIDSYLDNTDNLLKLPLIHECFQILAVDHDILIALTGTREITVVNTHKSVVPQKWPKKIVLPKESIFVRVDENVSIAFTQQESGEIFAVDISGDHSEIICSLGNYEPYFEIDQNGHLVALTKEGELVKIQTNSNNLVLDANEQSFTKIFKDISYLFQGEELFARTVYAQPVEEITESDEIFTDLDTARYDFEANLERQLVACGNDYEALLALREKLVIARQNIADEIIKASEFAGVFLVGQRLQSTVNQIVRPSQQRLQSLIEYARADWIMTRCQSFMEEIESLESPSIFHRMLNELRQFDSEIKMMSEENRERIINEFKSYQQKVGVLFSNQMSRDGASLNDFISSEIEQIEARIQETHDGRQLEILLSTEPAAIELFALLKQPYILQHINEYKSFSPAEIQTRLFKSIQNRKIQLAAEIAKKEKEEQKAKLQLASMIEKSILFFVQNHSKGFSDVELAENANYQSILSDILSLERNFRDVRMSMDLRRKLEKRIIERNREDLEKMVAYEGKYAYINNDPDLYVDLDSTVIEYPTWSIDLTERRGKDGIYAVSFIRNVDKAVYRPSTMENLESKRAFEIEEKDYSEFSKSFEEYSKPAYHYELLRAAWQIQIGKQNFQAFPQFSLTELQDSLANSKAEEKALRCALEKKEREFQEKNRRRNVPQIPVDFIDDTPYFQSKLQEFLIKAKLQLMSGSGIILLSGPPSTGKSAFLRFASALMNREYFEHASDKWQTKNSLVTAIKFGEYGPYSIPAGFTKAITTPHALINIEEIKEWPEALRKSLNPFFAGSPYFIGPDGTSYKIGENILLCAAANLGSMYRQDDEPFTADFWSRVEVIEYNYAPLEVNQDYLDAMTRPQKNRYLTIADLTKDFFNSRGLPRKLDSRAKMIAQEFLEFILLPKADEKIKKERLQNEIRQFFKHAKTGDSNSLYSPEESAKIALKRCTILQGYTLHEYYSLYNHFINDKNLEGKKLANIQVSALDKYNHLRFVFLSIFYIESCLRLLRENFYKTAGQSEIEGTNREFIQCVYLLNLIGMAK